MVRCRSEGPHGPEVPEPKQRPGSAAGFNDLPEEDAVSRQDNAHSRSVLDLVSLRLLVDAELCPSCHMPFDKGKKRKLIDACGHERCYSCLFRQETCPLCLSDGLPAKKSLGLCPAPPPPGPGRRINGHFTSYMQMRHDAPSPVLLTPEMSPRLSVRRSAALSPSPSRLPKARPARTEAPMTQSCPTPPQPRKRFFLKAPWAMRAARQSQHESADSQNALSDDETCPPKPTSSRSRSGQSDLYMRLGLLLGENAGRRGASGSVRSPPPPARQTHPQQDRNHESCASLSSLPSANTSPVSTLTGSSEADVVHSHLRVLKDPSSDSTTSLMSMSAHSNSSWSPVPRRHSATPSQSGLGDDLNLYFERRSPMRRSARSDSSRVSTEPKPRFPHYRTQQLTLRPLFFEVPAQETVPLFVGRSWLVSSIEDALVTNRGVVVEGGPGTGKTAFILQLVDHSCFGRRYLPDAQEDTASTEGIRHLASHVVAYHFCQADNNSTCLVADFIQSLAAQLCQAPQLAAYRQHLENEPYLQSSITMMECIGNPDQALNRGILEPLSSLRRVGKISGDNYLVLVDALCEAEYHRPDRGHSLASFLAAHLPNFPPWLNLVVTVRSQLKDVTSALPFVHISLDGQGGNDPVSKDILEYVSLRVGSSAGIQGSMGSSGSGIYAVPLAAKSEQFRFCQHVSGLARGSFLFAKLTLDLLERGHLVVKSSSYKVLPVSLAQIFLLHFNLRFPTLRSFEKVSPILAVCLAALYPLTLVEIFYSVNALLTENFLSWEDFLDRFQLLSGFLIKRADNTYMFFHPSFREWLIRRDDGESTKFLCDLRAGHAGIAFRLSRVQHPLDAEHTLELGHHILKAHLYKNMTLHRYSSRDLQAHWVASSSADVSSSLAFARNLYSPNVKVSRLMLLAGADPNTTTDVLGRAPALCVFAHEGSAEMVSLLIEFGADVEATNSQGCTALALAAIRGHIDVARILVGAGASLGHADTAGQCPLVHAARNGRMNVAGFLLNCDWVVSGPEDVSLAEAVQQGLVAASAQGHIELVEYLLDAANVHLDETDTLTGETALTIASTNGCHNMVSTLLSRGASVSTTNRKEMSALLLAVREGHWAVAERLLQHQAPVEQADPSNRSPLMLAAAEGHLGLLELLLDKGACVRQEDRDGMTALSWACLRSRLQAAQVLLDRGSDVNHCDQTGRSPLDLASFQGTSALITLLLERGALIEHMDMNGVRPLDRAIACRNINVVQCFLRKGAKLGPATWAMAAGKPEMMLALLNKLLEDGNVLYRKGRLQEASYRYQYALKKIPIEGESPEYTDSGSVYTFRQLRINFLLNQSRCKRKMNECEDAIELANQVLKIRPDSYEAYYALAKAEMDLKLFDKALENVQEALRTAPPVDREVRRVLLRLRDDIRAEKSAPASESGQLHHRSSLGGAVSVATLNEPETSL